MIAGCGTGEGAMLACNSFPGVICGYVEDALDAYTFSQVNDGNAIALPIWLGRRAEQRNKRILDEVRAHTYQDLTVILKRLDRNLVTGALAGEGFQKYFFENCKDSGIEACVRELLM